MRGNYSKPTRAVGASVLGESSVDQLGRRNAFDQAPEAARPVTRMPTAGPEIRHFLGRLNAGRATIGGAVACCLLAAVAYLVLSPPRYVAAATVFVDPARLNLPGQSGLIAERSADEASVESQVQMLRSDPIAKRAISMLNAAQAIRADDASFPLGRLRGWLFGSLTQADPSIDEAIGSLKNNLRVRRIGLTQVLEVSYSSTDPARASAVPNAIIDAYIEDKRQFLAEIVRKSVEWMNGELAKTKLQAEAAEQELEELKAKGGEGSSARYRARLRELDVYARSYRNTHEALLPRYNELLQKERQPVIDARILERARAPKGKSAPRTSLTLVLATLVGLMLGVGTTILRNYFAGLRSSHEVETALGLTALGVVPRLPPAGPPSAADAENKICAAVSGPARFVLDAPQSQHAEVLRAARAAIERRRGDAETCVVGVTSIRAGEGRSTLSTNLAQLLTATGASVLLIDADHSNRSLSHQLGTDGEPGLVNLVAGEARLSDLVWVDPVSGSTFLPAGTHSDPSDAARVLASGAALASRQMGPRIAGLAQGFDFVIICLQPIATSIDVASAADWVDSFILALEWDRAQPDAIKSALARAGQLGGKVAGVILNKADPVYLQRTDCDGPALGRLPWTSLTLPRMPSLSARLRRRRAAAATLASSAPECADSASTTAADGSAAASPDEPAAAAGSGEAIGHARSSAPEDTHETPVAEALSGSIADMTVEQDLAAPACRREAQATAEKPAAGAPSRGGESEAVSETADDPVPSDSELEQSAVRRLGGQLAGGMLKGTGRLARGIARARAGGHVTNIYFHQPDAAQFHGILAWLLNRGYRPVSTEDIAAAHAGELELPELALHVSLDDAFRSNLTEVVPVAQRLGVPITIFVPTEPVQRGWFWWTCVERAFPDGAAVVERLKSVPNGERRMHVAAALEKGRPPREAMTLDELRRIAALGHVTIGSHTVTHPILTRCSDAELEQELQESKSRLERWIGKSVEAFAYPNGSFGEREVEAVRRAGYKLAFTVEQRLADPSGEDPLRLPRNALLNRGPFLENLCRAVGIWSVPQLQPWRSGARSAQGRERPASISSGMRS